MTAEIEARYKHALSPTYYRWLCSECKEFGQPEPTPQDANHSLIAHKAAHTRKDSF